MKLESLELGAHPILDPFFERLKLRDFLGELMGKPNPRSKLPPVDSALVLLRNFILSRHPLYAIANWTQKFEPTMFGLEPEQLRLINDDRLGRTLDKIYTSDRRSMLTRFVVHLVDEFDVNLDRLHNDSTTITFSGEYRESLQNGDTKGPPRITHGYNKDHRPDLKQLVWSLTVSHDGAVPVHYNVYDGNTSDDTTHIGIWDSLCGIVGGPDFIYVADSKMCTRKNMAHVTQRGGHFITVMPRTRKEDARFKMAIANEQANWQLIWTRPSHRRKSDPHERYEAVEDPSPSSDGYRVIWYRSSSKWKRDEQARDDKITAARQELRRIGERSGKRKLKTRDQIIAAVDAVLEETGTRPWIEVAIEIEEIETHKQASPGRPGKDTLYVKTVSAIHRPVARLKIQAIRDSAATDGIFPLMTDMSPERMSALDVLSTYKYQPFLEKRHEQLKTAARVTPVNFKTPERIEAYLFLYFLAVTVHALIERKVRESMNVANIESIPIYPEERDCRAPTADKILDLFKNQRQHKLVDGNNTIKVFWDDLSAVQRQVLELLDIPTSVFGG